MFNLSKFSVIHQNRLFSVDKLLLSRNLEVKRYTTCNDKDAVKNIIKKIEYWIEHVHP